MDSPVNPKSSEKFNFTPSQSTHLKPYQNILSYIRAQYYFLEVCQFSNKNFGFE